MTDEHERLETLLSQAPHIDDEGFTEALMSRLPARRPTLRTRAVILLASTVASCGLVAVVPGARSFLAEIGLGLLGVGSGFFPAAAVVALLVWGAVAAATSEA
jgi:hypothetical protein